MKIDVLGFIEQSRHLEQAVGKHVGDPLGAASGLSRLWLDFFRTRTNQHNVLNGTE